MRRITGLAVVAALGGGLGLLAGLSELTAHLEVGGWGLVVILVILVASVAELGLAYSAWTRASWEPRPRPRSVAYAVAIALILLGVYVVIARLGRL